MAMRGNWREAKFRWEQIHHEQRDNIRLLNNLAVASEALGETDEARRYYEEALGQGADTRIEDNYRRFLRVLEETGRTGAEDVGAVASSARGKTTKGGKPERVSVGVPVPPRLELAGIRSLLVASFRAPDSSLLDINRELVRFMRSEFSKRTSLDVLDVVPPPAIPEQPVERLVANYEFWRHLSREHEADLIVSGVVTFDRRDASGFEDQDVISPQTGQKVRRAVFVEQEMFEYTLDVFFMDGPTGRLLFRDRLQRSVVFRGQMNDPITAFHELTDSMAQDVLAVVAPRRRMEPRLIFRR
jgi:hypothetical protein